MSPKQIPTLIRIMSNTSSMGERLGDIYLRSDERIWESGLVLLVAEDIDLYPKCSLSESSCFFGKTMMKTWLHALGKIELNEVQRTLVHPWWTKDRAGHTNGLIGLSDQVLSVVLCSGQCFWYWYKSLTKQSLCQDRSSHKSIINN